jgi:hypothetical protein
LKKLKKVWKIFKKKKRRSKQRSETNMMNSMVLKNLSLIFQMLPKMILMINQKLSSIGTVNKFHQRNQSKMKLLRNQRKNLSGMMIKIMMMFQCKWVKTLKRSKILLMPCGRNITAKSLKLLRLKFLHLTTVFCSNPRCMLLKPPLLIMVSWSDDYKLIYL